MPTGWDNLRQVMFTLHLLELLMAEFASLGVLTVPFFRKVLLGRDSESKLFATLTTF